MYTLNRRFLLEKKSVELIRFACTNLRNRNIDANKMDNKKITQNTGAYGKICDRYI